MYACVIEGVTGRVQRVFVFVNRVHESTHSQSIYTMISTILRARVIRLQEGRFHRDVCGLPFFKVGISRSLERTSIAVVASIHSLFLSLVSN